MGRLPLFIGYHALWLAIFFLIPHSAFAQTELLGRRSVFSCADGKSVLAPSRGVACLGHGGIATSKARASQTSPVKRDTGTKFCDATRASSGDGTGELRCGTDVCRKEYPEGKVVSFECSGDKCPVSNGTYAASCEARKFNGGCTVTYTDVTECKSP
jgi:hypothetical protein